MYKAFKTSIIFTGLDVSKEVEVKEIVEDVKEPEVIEKKSDSNIELVKVVATDIITNLSPILTNSEQDQDHELVTSNLSSFVTVTNDQLQGISYQKTHHLKLVTGC